MNAYISWIVKSLVDSLTSCHPLPLIRVLWVVFGEASTSRLEIKFKTCNFYFHQKKTGILPICILVELKHRKSFEKEKKNYRKPDLWSTASLVPGGKSKHMSLCSRADPGKFLLVKDQTLEILFLNWKEKSDPGISQIERAQPAPDLYNPWLGAGLGIGSYRKPWKYHLWNRKMIPWKYLGKVNRALCVNLNNRNNSNENSWLLKQHKHKTEIKFEYSLVEHMSGGFAFLLLGETITSGKFWLRNVYQQSHTKKPNYNRNAYLHQKAHLEHNKSAI